MYPPAGKSVDDQIRPHTIKNEGQGAATHQTKRGLPVAKATNDVNKSEAVREALAQNPGATSKEIVSLLAQQRLRVKPALVYSIKWRLKLRKRRQQRQAATENSRETSPVDPVKLVMQVKSLANQAGGVRKLQQLVDALAE
jgi:hypothetical protein